VRIQFIVVLLLLSSSALFAGTDTKNQPDATGPVSVAGKWQVSLQARLGTVQATVDLQQDGSKLSGTFQESKSTSSLTGAVDGANVSFDVQFQGPRPYTIEFLGKVDGDKITGTSVAKNVGTAGAYLGHGGEIVQPEHPWTATREPDSAKAKN